MKNKWFFLFLTSCSSPLKLPIWTYSNYSLCEPNLSSDLEELPFGLLLNINRYDLNRYDALGSSRPFLISQDLEVTDLGSPLIPNSQIGQVYIFGSSLTSEAYLNYVWREPQNGVYEEAIKSLNINSQTYRSDIIRYSLESQNYENLTSSQEVSFYNSQAIPLLGKLLFTALVGDQLKPFIMDFDGSNKEPLTANSGYIYGLSISPNGLNYAFHSNYKIYIGDFGTHNEILINTPCPFNFGPVWSQDSSRIVFSCGSHDSPDLWVSDYNGQNTQFLASRNGYSGTVPFTSQYDFHTGNSDIFVWVEDSVIHGALIGGAIELVRSYLNGTQEQLTFSNPGDRNVNPAISKDSQWLLYNKNNNAFYMNLETSEITQITDLAENCNPRLGSWQKTD